MHINMCSSWHVYSNGGYITRYVTNGMFNDGLAGIREQGPTFDIWMGGYDCTQLF